MGKRSIITPQRLEDGAGRAKAELFKRFCAALKHNGVDTKVSLDCKYKGTVQEDAPLHSNTRVIYTWRVNGKDIKYETLACKLYKWFVCVLMNGERAGRFTSRGSYTGIGRTPWCVVACWLA